MVIVIGGSGFLGSYLRRAFASLGMSYLNVDKVLASDEIRQIQADLTDEAALNEVAKEVTDAEVLINLAAEHRDDVRPKEKYYSVNVDGARLACKLASEVGVKKIIFTSSVAIYGFAKPGTGEGGDINYFNEYGRTKYLAERVYLDWQAEEPMTRSLFIIRPTVIFGPGNRGNVFNLLSQIASNRFAMFGNGRNIKSMAYVENVAMFIAKCAAAGSGVQIYNYVDKPDLSMNELVRVARRTLFNKAGIGLRLPAFLGILIGWAFDLLSWLINKPMPISSIRVKKFMATTQFSSAVSETNFNAPFTLSEGLEKTLRYEFLEDNGHKQTYETE